MDDERILALYWARDEAAIAATAARYGGYCRTIADNILHSAEDAEECCNDTWLGAWRSIPPQRPRRLGAYLGKLTRNLALNRFRAAGAEKRGGGQVPLALSELEDCLPAARGAEAEAEAAEIAAAVGSFLRAQPRLRREVFLRRYWYLDPIRDIARAYGMGESRVASLLYRMREQLKRHLEQEGIVL